MGKKIGIVICNFNKRDFIVNCIHSVFNSSINDFEIYVVDNASTDDSVKCIQKEFGNRIMLLINRENLGGSGGFNTGIREALKHGHKYIMLMDNDIIVDKKAVEELYRFMEQHHEVGIVGSKVYFMDYPKQIWGYGGNIDWQQYLHRDQYKNCIDGVSIPEVSYCDYVAACSLMTRTDAIREVGLMPEENFIYWDDIEWGYRFNEAGYKVAVYGKSMIWHKAGGRNAGNTFIHYYMWRNRIRFFLKILSKEKKKQFAETILKEMFQMIYSVNLKGETNIVKTLMYAFDDAVHGICGKAAEGKILPRPKVCNRLKLMLGEAESVIIKFNGDMEGLGNIIRSIGNVSEKIKISITVQEQEKQKVAEQFVDSIVQTEYNPEMYDKHLIMCEHIFKLQDNMLQDNYIDSWCNIIYSEEDFTYAKSFKQTEKLFLLCKMGQIV